MKQQQASEEKDTQSEGPNALETARGSPEGPGVV